MDFTLKPFGERIYRHYALILGSLSSKSSLEVVTDELKCYNVCNGQHKQFSPEISTYRPIMSDVANACADGVDFEVDL